MQLPLQPHGVCSGTETNNHLIKHPSIAWCLGSAGRKRRQTDLEVVHAAQAGLMHACQRVQLRGRQLLQPGAHQRPDARLRPGVPRLNTSVGRQLGDIPARVVCVLQAYRKFCSQGAQEAADFATSTGLTEQMLAV